MSAAIKRLSTIIKPHNSSPSKETTKETTDSADPAAATETPTQMAPTIEAPVANGDSAATPADANAVKDTITAPDGETVAIPTSTTEEANDAQDVPVPAATETETAKDVATDAEKDKESKPTPRRRDPRDIGLSTIRRFSTILRSQGKDAHKETPPPVPTSTQKEDGEAQAVSTESAAGTDAVAAAPEPAKDDAKATKDNAKSSEKDAKPAEKDAAAATEASKAKSNGDAAAPTKRRSSFFSAVQRTAKDVQTRARGPAKPKAAPKPKIEAVVVPKIVKKGAARGKRVVVVTGASKGVGLEIVKQFCRPASQTHSSLRSHARRTKLPRLSP
ncbi:hypothetical protein K439DRAFT_699746 [Ramaria rubella]|nr:hypothetical protein K439DRAFT_699746 [Ramaria rubella]